jgi:transcriptional regulator with XRE-family HTH domain
MLQATRILNGAGSADKLAQKVGIAPARYAQLESGFGTPTKFEEAAIRKILGSADYLFEAATEENRFKARVRF